MTMKPPTIMNLFRMDTLIRILADVSLVHICMLAAVSLSVIYETHTGQVALAASSLEEFRRYYVKFFTPLSLTFPLVFVCSGFYTRSRGYATRYKALDVSQAAGGAVLLFIVINYVLFRQVPVARNIALTFCGLVMFVIPVARLAKSLITRHLSNEPGDNRAPSLPAAGRHVLVVGGAGYIGSQLVRLLLEKGWRVRVLDNLVYGDAAIRDLNGTPGFELMVGDCRNIQCTVAAVKGVEAIIHLAAIVGDPACEQDRQTALEINYAATRMLIEVAKGHGIGRFVFTSSCSVYGATELLMDESSPVEPISLYAETKVDSEYALLAARSETFHPVILRLATVFGHSHRPRFDLVVNLLAAKAYQEGTITIYNGTQWRPFIHVRDVARGLVAVLEVPLDVVSGQIYNLGDSRQNCTLSDIADKVRSIISNTRIVHVENSDRRNYRVSFEKIRNQLGFECNFSVEDGIRELKSTFEEGRIKDYSSFRYNNQKHLSVAGSPTHTCDVDAQIMAAFAAVGGAKLARTDIAVLRT